MHAKKLSINTGFPNSQEKDIIRQICNNRHRRCIFVQEFPRFGFSGARLLLVYFNRAPKGLPFLVKIAKQHDIALEYRAVDSMRDLVADCRLEVDKIFRANGLSALLYPHRGTDTPLGADRPLSFREILYSKRTNNKAPVPKNKLSSILYEVYDKLRNAHSGFKEEEIDVRGHYKKYFRRHVARERIGNILGSSRDSETFRFISTKIYNPLKLMDELPPKAIVFTARVHGDLHPDNIILDRQRNPNLIDFAWAEQPRDVLIDFVLLENSIRFMHFPRSANLEEQLRVDKYLLDENGWELISDDLFGDPSSQRVYSRLASVVGMIRKKAREVLGDKFTIQRYLFTQFIVLYGLMRFETYEAYTTTRALGMIAKKLRETGWGFIMRGTHP